MLAATIRQGSVRRGERFHREYAAFPTASPARWSSNFTAYRSARAEDADRPLARQKHDDFPSLYAKTLLHRFILLN